MIPMVIVWSFAIHPIMIAFGFDEATAQKAQEFAYWEVIVETIGGVHEVYGNFLSVIDREVWDTIIALVGEFLFLLLLVVTCSVLTQETTLNDVRAMYLFTEIVMLCFNLIFTIRKGWVSKYLSGMIGNCALKVHF